MEKEAPCIVISRTDNLGDVILTLPMAGFIKQHMPKAKVYFIGKAYTKAVINSSSFIDGFIDKKELLKDTAVLEKLSPDYIIFVYPDKDVSKIAKQLKIPQRVGTSHRLHHILHCNKLINFSRKNSDLHEAQLNLKLLKPLSLPIEDLSLENFADWYGLSPIPLSPKWQNYLSKNKYNLILHPKSKGSAKEWDLQKYYDLAKQLEESAPDKYHILITGTKSEGELIKSELPTLLDLPNIFDMTGRLTLTELISFISKADGLLACSTGPLHIAAALGIDVFGLYPSERPIHPGRWQPVGKKANYLSDPNSKDNTTLDISVQKVIDLIESSKK